MRLLLTLSLGSLGVSALLTACAAPAEDAAGPAVVSSGLPERDLVVEIDPGDGTPAQRWTVACGSAAAGDHPDAARACAHLLRAEDPFAPLPPDLVCTEQYGGPQTARVTGTWDAEPVDLELSRVDGCRIAQWESLGPLLPLPVEELESPS
jgi:hypothetical protein